MTRRPLIVHLSQHGAALYLLRTPLARTADRSHVETSRWTWGPEDPEPLAGDGPRRYSTEVYRLTPLGVLHTLTGLTVCTTPRTALPQEHLHR